MVFKQSQSRWEGVTLVLREVWMSPVLFDITVSDQVTFLLLG
ncbi:uncharacterized protein METZ01_LOCUS448166, partial [marine metagenome]